MMIKNIVACDSVAIIGAILILCRNEVELWLKTLFNKIINTMQLTTIDKSLQFV